MQNSNVGSTLLLNQILGGSGSLHGVRGTDTEQIRVFYFFGEFGAGAANQHGNFGRIDQRFNGQTLRAVVRADQRGYVLADEQVRGVDGNVGGVAYVLNVQNQLLAQHAAGSVDFIRRELSAFDHVFAVEGIAGQRSEDTNGDLLFFSKGRRAAESHHKRKYQSQCLFHIRPSLCFFHYPSAHCRW